MSHFTLKEYSVAVKALRDQGISEAMMKNPDMDSNEFLPLDISEVVRVALLTVEKMRDRKSEDGGS